MKWNLRLAQFLQRLLPFRAAHALTDSEEGANAPNSPTVSRTNQEQDLGEVSAENDCTRRPCSRDRFHGARPHGSKPFSFAARQNRRRGEQEIVVQNQPPLLARAISSLRTNLTCLLGGNGRQRRHQFRNRGGAQRRSDDAPLMFAKVSQDAAGLHGGQDQFQSVLFEETV